MTQIYLKKTKVLLHFFIGTLLLFAFQVNAQCPPGDVTLSTQAEIDQFIIDYPTCTTISGNLTIGGSNITNLNGLNNIINVTGYVGVYNNTQLQNFTGLQNLNTIGLSLDVSNNPGLLNSNGLSGLTDVGTEIQFYNNPQLQNVNDLSALTAIGGGLWIIDNAQLQNLNGLQNIQQVGGDIDITGNTTLNDISFLQNIDPLSIIPSGTFGLTIVNNPALAVCNLSNFCTYLTNPVSTHPRTISGNLANCLDEVEVVAACTLSTDDFIVTNISVYPNPAKETLHFSADLSNVKIIDISGKTVKQLSAKTASVNVADLQKGIYILSGITEEGTTISKKIIKE